MSAPTLNLEAIELEGFAREIAALKSEIRASLGPDDLRHLRRIERWGRAATAVGLATAWIAPNPLSAVALALGRSTRWLLMHHSLRAPRLRQGARRADPLHVEGLRARPAPHR